jgi:hypothetical protein
MSFTLTPYQGWAQEVAIDLEVPAQNRREEETVSAIKDSVVKIVAAMGGYISVTGNGHLNPIAGETGDSVSINIVSISSPPMSSELEYLREDKDEHLYPEQQEEVLQAPDSATSGLVQVSQSDLENIFPDNPPFPEQKNVSDQPVEPPVVQPVQVIEGGEIVN